jgi:DNA-directed RNA polymerase subunit K/omega
MKTSTPGDASVPRADSAAEPQLGRFHVASLAMLRTKQLQSGATPRVAVDGHKVCRLALLEVLAGTMSWSVDAPVVSG